MQPSVRLFLDGIFIVNRGGEGSNMENQAFSFFGEQARGKMAGVNNNMRRKGPNRQVPADVLIDSWFALMCQQQFLNLRNSTFV